jgi:hypothetical protein
MNLNLIYIDDFGNTGNKTDDLDQPVFMLSGLVVPAERVTDLEIIVLRTIFDLCRKAEISAAGFELHGVDLFAKRNRQLAKVPFEERVEAIFHLAIEAIRLGAGMAGVFVEKSKLADLAKAETSDEAFERDMQGVIDMITRSNLPLPSLSPQQMAEYKKGWQRLKLQQFSPYVIAFSSLVVAIDELQRNFQRSGILIIDQQQQFKGVHYLASSRTYRMNRNTPNAEALSTPTILEQPLQGDGKSNFLLQLADVFGYIIGRDVRDYVQEKQSPNNPFRSILSVLTHAMNIRPVADFFDDRRAYAIGVDLAHYLIGEPLDPAMAAMFAIAQHDDFAAAMKDKGEEHQ